MKVLELSCALKASRGNYIELSCLQIFRKCIWWSSAAHPWVKIHNHHCRLIHYFLWSSTNTGIWVWWVLKSISQNYLVKQITYNWNRSWSFWIAFIKWTQILYLSNFTIFSKYISDIKMLSNTGGRAVLINVSQHLNILTGALKQRPP